MGTGCSHPRLDLRFQRRRRGKSLPCPLRLYAGTNKQPLVYTLVGECSSTRLRGQTIGIARNTYILCALPVAFIANYSMNPSAWGWGTYAGLFWVSRFKNVPFPLILITQCGTCLTLPVWAYFRLPETKGRSFRELDILFEDKVPARQFSTTVVSRGFDEVDLAQEQPR